MNALDIELDDPGRGVRLSFAVPLGRTTALVGPNGSGKSTALATVAGIHRPAASRIVLDGRDLTRLAPYRRRVALLTQEPLLLPHLTVLENVAFGLRAQGMRPREARSQALGWLERVDAAHLADRAADRLSGGQAQRVAIARALAAEPDVVLLDEPLAALDVDAAPAVRHVLREVLDHRTAVVVTHDVVDAVLLADEVVVLSDGRVVEQGPVRRIVEAPRSPFAARLAGLNLVEGTMSGEAELTTDQGLVITGLPGTEIGTGAPATATFRPESVAVHREPPGGSPRNRFTARVRALEPSGAAIRLRATTGIGPVVADLTPAAVAELGLRVGDEVHLVVKAAAIRLDGA